MKALFMITLRIIYRTLLDNAVCYDMLDPSAGSSVSNITAEFRIDI